MTTTLYFPIKENDTSLIINGNKFLAKQIKIKTDIEKLKQIKKLEIGSLYWLDDFSDILSKMKNLNELDMASIQNFSSFNWFKCLKTIKKLRLYACRIAAISFGDVLSNALEYLNLCDNYNLANIDCLKKCENLRYLNIAGCVNLKSIDVLEYHKKLRTLYMDKCKGINDISVLYNLPLIKVNVKYCNLGDDQINTLQLIVLKNIAISFHENDYKKAMEGFNQVPDVYKNKIYKILWKQKNGLADVEYQFGENCFHNKYNRSATNKERYEVIMLFYNSHSNNTLIDKHECIICYEKEISTVFLCGHACLCKLCAIRTSQCPLCRVDSFAIPLYYS